MFSKFRKYLPAFAATCFHVEQTMSSSFDASRFESLDSTLLSSVSCFSIVVTPSSVEVWLGVVSLSAELERFLESLSPLYLSFQINPLHICCLPFTHAAILPPLE